MHKLTVITALLAGALLAGACSTAGPGDPATDVGPRVQAATSEPTATTATDGERPEKMLRMVLRLTADGVETVSSVEAPNTMNRRDPHRRSATFYRVVGTDGAVLAERGFRLADVLRAETAGPDGEIDAEMIRPDEPVFEVKVPLHEGLEAVRFFRGAPDGTRDGAELLGEVRP